MKKAKLNFFRPKREHEAFMQRRVSAFIHHYGRNIATMPIETLALSCYSQGVEDCLQLTDKQNAINLPPSCPH